MQLTLFTITGVMGFTSAAAISTPSATVGKLVARQGSVCGALATPVCCQLDVLGVANLNCENGTYFSLSCKTRTNHFGDAFEART